MYRFFLILALSLPAYGGGEVSDIVKKNSEFINDFAADSIYSFFAGPGYTEVEMRGIENKKPEFSILPNFSFYIYNYSFNLKSTKIYFCRLYCIKTFIINIV